MLKSSLIGSIISTIDFICEAKQSAPYIAVLKKSVPTLSVWYVYLRLPSKLTQCTVGRSTLH